MVDLKTFGGFVVAMRVSTASLTVPAGAEALWGCNSVNLTILSKSSITHAMLHTNPQTPSYAEDEVDLSSCSTTRQTALTTSPFPSLTIPPKSPDTKHCLPNLFATSQNRLPVGEDLVIGLIGQYHHLVHLILQVESSQHPYLAACLQQIHRITVVDCDLRWCAGEYWSMGATEWL